MKKKTIQTYRNGTKWLNSIRMVVFLCMHKFNILYDYLETTIEQRKMQINEHFIFALNFETCLIFQNNFGHFNQISMLINLDGSEADS